MFYGITDRLQVQVQPLQCPGQSPVDKKITVTDIVPSGPLEGRINQTQHNLGVSWIRSSYSHAARSAVDYPELYAPIPVVAPVALQHAEPGKLDKVTSV